ncbi:MAG: hypothetical protein J6Y27_01705 [Bacteroidales bacterium]|nr:hypothetical protein [Bacteroidales bacterium]
MGTKMNKRQKLQIVLLAIFTVLIIVWLIMPGWSTPKILGIISNALCGLSMILSYRAEERMKQKDD